MSLQKFLRFFAVFLFVFLFLYGASSRVAAYTPIEPDLVLYDGGGRTTGVFILNLTPYNMSAIYGGVNTNMNSTPMTLRNLMEKARNCGVTSPFTPIGFPANIPAAGMDFKPIPMAVAFEDGYNYVNAFSAMWTINNVQTIVNGRTISGNAKFSINFNRSNPKADEKAGLFKLVSDAVKECIDIVRIAINTSNPIPWVKAFTAADELVTDGTNFGKMNSQKTEGDEVYVSAYIVASNGYGIPATTPPPGWVPSDGENRTTWADDSVIAQQSTSNGDIEASMVVTTQILRGQDADSGKDNGTAPLMMVTVALASDWAQANMTTALYAKPSFGKTVTLSKAATEIRRYLDQHGEQGKRNLTHLVRSMDRSKHETLVNASHAILGVKKFNRTEQENQETLLKEISNALNKGRERI